MPVAERLNYSLRPNKNVERKLMAGVLQRLMPDIPVDEFRYVGMGSLWFVDFVLLHRLLGIRDMVSVERDLVDRARFNQPYECIVVQDGEMGAALKQLTLEGKRSIIWLDYESGIEGPALEDLNYVCERVPSGSVVIVTVQARSSRLNNQRDPDGGQLTPEEALRLYAGDLVPRPLPEHRLDQVEYRELISELLTRAVKHSLAASGRPERYYQLFDYTYRDGAPMVTVGGLIMNEPDATRIPWARLRATEGFVADGDAQQRIKVPVLTLKEKAALDQLLPRAGGLQTVDVKGQCDITIQQEHLDAYSRYYLQYPVFGELLA